MLMAPRRWVPGSGTLSFDDFVDMMAVFSYRTPAEVKLIWAFAMWGASMPSQLCERPHLGHIVARRMYTPGSQATELPRQQVHEPHVFAICIAWHGPGRQR
jgi:hypothetical protein